MKFATAVVLCAMSAASSAQALWSASSAGMSLPQLLAAVPEAREATTRDALKSGEARRAEVVDIEIAGLRCDVGFYFAADKLGQARMKCKGGPGTTGAADQIRQGLRAKYGPEAADNIKAVPGTAFGTARWISERTEVEMTILVDMKSSFVMVDYRKYGLSGKL